MLVRIFIVLLFLVPTASHAAVLINEIAWMGTEANVNDEWIELYNDGSDTVVLDGWILSDDVSLHIDLAGAVGAGEYALLERTDDTTVPDIPAFQIYTGALANDGRTLVLRRDDASIEDQVAGGADWENVGGDNDTKETAQRTAAGWITGTPTPGTSNVTEGTSPGEHVADEAETTSSVTTRTTSSGGGASVRKSTIEKKTVLTNPVLTLSIDAQKLAYVNQTIPFAVTPSGIGQTIMNSLTYTWNFGDTYGTSSKNTTHAFSYPGEYVVVVEAKFAKEKAIARQEITVLPLAVSLARSPVGDVLLHNNAKYEVDIGGFTLKSGASLTLPKFIILKPNATLTIGAQRLRAEQGRPISLYNALGMYVLSDSVSSVVVKPSLAASSVSVPTKAISLGQNNTTILVQEDTQEIGGETQEGNSTEASTTIIQIGTPAATIAATPQGFFTKENLPYIGLFGIMSLGILTLYTRRH